MFFDQSLSRDFVYRCKQAGQLLSKTRFDAAQCIGLLGERAWLRYAAHANAMARKLHSMLRDVVGHHAMFPVEANGVGGAFGIGLLASFGVLAVLAVGLRVLSWGGLFQKPIFVGVIVIVSTAMAIGQFGFFNLRLPSAVYGLTPRHVTYSGNFLFCALTAALSTPCTIGMGMALPYLILSGFPGLARRFPRTGPLGEIAKQAMAFGIDELLNLIDARAAERAT